jgi:hypothetical protein
MPGVPTKNVYKVGRNFPARSYLPIQMIHLIAWIPHSAATSCKTGSDTRTYPFASHFIFS